MLYLEALDIAGDGAYADFDADCLWVLHAASTLFLYCHSTLAVYLSLLRMLRTMASFLMFCTQYDEHQVLFFNIFLQVQS